MAGPQVHTARDPSGGSSFWNTGWAFVGDKVFNKDPAGTSVKTSNADAWAISIASIDLWGTLSIDAVYAAVVAHGGYVYYLSLWRNPPRLLGTGADYYRVVAITRP